jgi:hypothetical protein
MMPGLGVGDLLYDSTSLLPERMTDRRRGGVHPITAWPRNRPSKQHSQTAELGDAIDDILAPSIGSVAPRRRQKRYVKVSFGLRYPKLDRDDVEKGRLA